MLLYTFLLFIYLFSKSIRDVQTFQPMNLIYKNVFPKAMHVLKIPIFLEKLCMESSYPNICSMINEDDVWTKL